MNKKAMKAIFGVMFLLFTALALSACGGNDNETITFDGGTLENGYVNNEYNATVDTATGADDISYALTSESELPQGLSLSSNGQITGQPTEAVENHTFVVVATSESGAESQATFTITIQIDLVYEGDILSDGQVGSTYTASVSTATGSEDIEYTLKDGETLPSGLTLSSDGVISGIPTEGAVDHTFVVVASADNAVSAEAEYVISISSTIDFSGTTLPNGYVDSPYSTSIVSETAGNGLTYSLKEGNTLPEGLTLSTNGVIYGTPETTATEITFVVVATANESNSVEATFTISVEDDGNLGDPETLNYTGDTLPDAEINKEYNENIATATGANDILYALQPGSSLPEGLNLSNDGTITGTPLERVSEATFTVVATAENATPVEVTFTLSVKGDSKTYVFETEFTDISDLEGGGISGAPSSPEDMIQYSSEASADYYLGFTHRTGLTITYEIRSDSNTNGSLSIRVGTELSTSMIVNPNIIEIQVNGVTINFDEFTIPQNESYTQEFIEVVINDNINLIEGDNIITLTVLENDYLNGGTGSPVYDNISITTDADLSWDPITSNIE